MKILVATRDTQGYREDDFSFVPDGEIVMPHYICDRDQHAAPGDPGCGCARSLTGITCLKSTTTFKVAEVNMEMVGLYNVFFNALTVGGYVNARSKNEMLRRATLWADEIFRVAQRFPVGAVLELRNGHYDLRELAPTNALRDENELLRRYIRNEQALRQLSYGSGEWISAYNEQQLLIPPVWKIVFGATYVPPVLDEPPNPTETETQDVTAVLHNPIND